MALPALAAEIKRVKVLSGGKAEVRKLPDRILMDLSMADRQEIAIVIKLTLAGDASGMKAMEAEIK